MILLQINQLDKYFGAELILSKMKLEVQTRDKIALVGRNGAGKSTLLKIIAGQLSYDSGEIIRPKGVTIGYLAQNTGLESIRTIWDEMLTVFTPLIQLEQTIRGMERKMANLSPENNACDERLLQEYDRLQLKFKDDGGYQYEADIRSVLHGLGFYKSDYTRKISHLSGGQKTRLALGKLLLTKPDILILDEPTNHLDIDTLSWLEQFLLNYDGALLIVSHDRYFLDKIVHTVYEVSRGSITKYTGNYSEFLTRKAENYDRDLKLYEKQQAEIAQLKDFVQKNIARASTTKRAQSRRKQLERMEVVDRPIGDDKSASFSFHIEKQSGNEVLNVEDLAVGYNEERVSSHINLRLTRGESIALIGPNGIGKSTFIKTIANKLEPVAGRYQTGTNVTIGYYDQEQASLSSNKRVLDELWDDFPTSTEKEVRTVLGNFLFSGDDVLKTVSALSGGEKARLALAKLYMKKANFLILDEPTNHLDLDSKEVLENALIDYPGTILFVSHDRYFINRIATKVVELSAGGATEYLGDYNYYVAKKQVQTELGMIEDEASTSTAHTSNHSVANAKLSYEQEKEYKRQERQRLRRIEEIEHSIGLLENSIAENEQLLCDPNIFQDHEKVLKINQKNELAQNELDELLDEWARLSE